MTDIQLYSEIREILGLVGPTILEEPTFNSYTVQLVGAVMFGSIPLRSAMHSIATVELTLKHCGSVKAFIQFEKDLSEEMLRKAGLVA